jgi:hypothetical protein
MQTKSTFKFSLVLLLLIACISPMSYSQARKPPLSLPRIDVLDCKIEADLMPDAHELNAVATIKFNPLESTDFVVFELSENLWIERVLNE